MWDGVDLRDIPPPALRERIGAVFQDHMIFDMHPRTSGSATCPPWTSRPESERRPSAQGCTTRSRGCRAATTRCSRARSSPRRSRAIRKRGWCFRAGSGSVSRWPGPLSAMAGI
ncbi:hypothetical protein [Nonomuraea sp. NPDC003201]